MQNKVLIETINNFIDSRPKTIDVIGYGSAVKTQANDHTEIKKQIDVIATTDSIVGWHKENRMLHKEEYNPIAPIFFNKPFMHFGTDIQYVSNVQYNDRLFKVGIIERCDLIKDLEEWKNFYMAGRFQKPVLVVRGDDKLDNATKRNRLNALRTILLLNYGDTISEEELYKHICTLSYFGDARMALNLENPKKISNIVTGEFDELRKIYMPFFEDLCYLEDGVVKYDVIDTLKCIDDFPKHLLDFLLANDVKINDFSKENIDLMRYYILRFIIRINSKSSICQPIKSSAINNFSSSKTYLSEKRKKYVINKQ